MEELALSDLEFAAMYASALILPAMTLAIFLSCAVGGYIIAFRSSRPGGYWMLAAALVFVAQFLYYVTFRNYTYDPASEMDLSLTGPIFRAALRPAIPLIPVLLFAIGFIRLAWSLRHGKPERGAEAP